MAARADRGLTRAFGLLVAFAAALLCLAGCQSLVGVTPSPAPSVTPQTTLTPSPTASPAQATCSFVSETEITTATGASSAYAPPDSTAAICVFDVATSQ